MSAAEEMRKNLKTMILMREFERVIKDLANEKDERIQRIVDGAVHCATGEEAGALGVCLNLRREDYVFSTHRGHGHAIAKGLDLKGLFAELMGRTDGVSGGMGGSMHLFDRELGFMGGNGIVGGGVTLALGTAYASRYREDGKVTVCFFSDGASNEGWCHEAMNMASLWKLPLVFVCENNLFAATTPSYKALSHPDIYTRGAAYAMPGLAADGNDLEDCIAVAKTAVDRARSGEGPSLLEIKTYRWEGHCRVIEDLPVFRPREEVQWWHDRDCIQVYARKLIDRGILDEEGFRGIRQEVLEEIGEAVAWARKSPRPDVNSFMARIEGRYAL